MISGIYKITNIFNNKIYIGSSSHLVRRKNSHYSTLDLNKHPNTHLQRSYNKYGKDSFIFEILMTCPVDDLIRIEQYFINNYQPQYNISKVAGSNRGIVKSIETREKLRIAHTGKKHSEETLQKLSAAKKGKKYSYDEKLKKYKNVAKPVYQIDLETLSIINTFRTITEASQSVGCNVSNISAVIQGKAFSAKGFAWCLVDEYDRNLLIKKKNERPHKQVEQYDLDMNYIRSFNSIVEAAKFVGTHDTCIGNNIRGKTKHSKGFLWKYKYIENGN